MTKGGKTEDIQMIKKVPNKEQDKHKVLQIARTSCLMHMKDDWQNQKQGKRYQEQMRSPFLAGQTGRGK